MLKKLVQNIPNNWRNVILEYIQNNPDEWCYLEDEFQKRKTIKSSPGEIFPNNDDIFKSFHYFDPESTQVVILGQDPYHQPNQAIGISFGVNNNTKIPPSLKNIEKELINDIGNKLQQHNLLNWVQQGVLMLNASLTVLQSKPSSHMKLWEPFTKYIIEYINQHNNNVVFVAWGKFAYEKMQHINTQKHLLLVSSHPSPFSYYRQFRNFPSFKNSKPFSKINNYIKNTIIW